MTRSVQPSLVGYALVESALGLMGIAWSDAGLMRLQLPERDLETTAKRISRGSALEAPTKPPPAVQRAADLLVRYAAGERVDFSDLPVDLADATSFNRQVYAATRAVKWGETTTYGALAKSAGEPGAARAAGQAMGSNPLPIIIPCHRVLASGERIGGFSAYGGRITKERLLAIEGVYPGSGTPPLPGLFPGDR